MKKYKSHIQHTGGNFQNHKTNVQDKNTCNGDSAVSRYLPI